MSHIFINSYDQCWSTFYSLQLVFPVWWGFPDSSTGKESACNAGDLGLVSRLGGSPGEGNGNPLQYFCLNKSHGQSLVGLKCCKEWNTTECAVSELSHILTHWSFITIFFENKSMEAQTCSRWLRKKPEKEPVLLEARKVLSYGRWWHSSGWPVVLGWERDHRSKRLEFSKEGWHVDHKLGRSFRVGWAMGVIWWICEVKWSHLVVSNSLRPHGL